MLEITKAASFLASILSLYPAMFSAFFVPGMRWEERLFLSLDKIAIAACICFASGLLFTRPTPSRSRPPHSLLETLPVRMFFCALGAMMLLFLTSWYLAEYYIPLTYKRLPW